MSRSASRSGPVWSSSDDRGAGCQPDAGFSLLDEDVDDHGDWGYRLFLMRLSQHPTL
jgi:hypothetical protein